MDDKIKQAEDALLESLSGPQSYETDGERISMVDPEKRLNVIRGVRKAKIKNPFGALGICRISTEGAGR